MLGAGYLVVAGGSVTIDVVTDPTQLPDTDLVALFTHVE